jgi:hypothetical protein
VGGLDHLVRGGEQRRWYCDGKQPSGLQVDDEAARCFVFKGLHCQTSLTGRSDAKGLCKHTPCVAQTTRDALGKDSCRMERCRGKILLTRGSLI